MKTKSPRVQLMRTSLGHSWLGLGVILVLAAVLRLSALAENPAVLNRDEAALAYNAYLLQQTGQDEWQRRWPLALESFGDYKLPGYSWLLQPSLTIFGLTDWAVRLPAALAGIILVGLTYGLSRRVLQLKRLPSLLVSLSVATQPVFIFYSRMAWEANVALSLLIGAVWLLFHHRSQPSWWQDTLAILLLLAGTFTYNTPWLLLPVLAGCLLIWRHGRWRQLWWPILGMALTFLVGWSAFASLSQQKSGITIFSDETLWMQSVEYYNSFTGWQQTLFGNRYLFFARELGQRLIDSFSYQFLVLRGGTHPWQSLPDFGHLYAVTYFTGLLGLGLLLKRVFGSRSSTLSHWQALSLLLLFLAALLPAIITVDAPHATRSLFFIYLWVLLSGLFFDWIWRQVGGHHRGQGWVVAAWLLILAGLGWQSSNYLRRYFAAYPQQSATILQAGLAEQLWQLEQQLGDRTDQVAIVDPDGFLYISVAWYLRLSPNQFWTTIERHLPDRIGFRYGYRVGRYRFIAQYQDRQPGDTRVIYWQPEQRTWVVIPPL